MYGSFSHICILELKYSLSILCDLKKIVINAYTFDFNEWRIDQNECRAVLQNDERLCSLSIYFVQYLKADDEMTNCFDHCRSCLELSNCFVECAIWCSNSFAQLLNSGARCRSVLANDECWNRCSNSYVEWSNASAKRCTTHSQKKWNRVSLNDWQKEHNGLSDLPIRNKNVFVDIILDTIR